jgi:hypothetical protein
LCGKYDKNMNGKKALGEEKERVLKRQIEAIFD